MSLDPICGPGSSSSIYIRSLVSAYFTSLTVLCSSLLTSILSFVNDLAVRVHSSCCPVCQYDRLRESYINKTKREKENVEKTTAVVFDPATQQYTVEDIDNIDVEKACRRSKPPILEQSFRVQVGGEKKSLAEFRFSNARKKSALVDHIYIMETRPKTQKTMSTKDPNDDQRVRLPSNQKELPVVPSIQEEPLAELAANEIPRRSSSTPKLASPQPPSPNTDKELPLLVPPKDDALKKLDSQGISMRSASIEIALQLSLHDDVERENPVPLKASNPLPPIPSHPKSPVSYICFVVIHNVAEIHANR